MAKKKLPSIQVMGLNNLVSLISIICFIYSAKLVVPSKEEQGKIHMVLLLIISESNQKAIAELPSITKKIILQI